MRPRFDDEDYDDEQFEARSRSAHDGWFDAFYADGLITDVLMPLKSGKEALVYLCRANPAISGAELLAAKVFRRRETRGFKNNMLYKQGQLIGNARDRRAIRRKSGFGRVVEEGWWRSHEFEVLTTLHAAGADVPKPVAAAEAGVLMEYIGDAATPAPQLHGVRLSGPDARAVFDRLLWNIELFLANNVIHADLSPYNVLYWERRAVIIDLPQAIDARTNPSARSLLGRDMQNLCQHFERQGIRLSAPALAGDLWRRFLHAEL